jgi:putative integral membrane protein (TIGR02587 family)
MSTDAIVAERGGVRQELDDLLRGACGGVLFGVPLLYTMEVWWIGSIASPRSMLLVLAGAFAVVLVLNRTGGFRATNAGGMGDAAMDAVEALAIGLVCVTAVLILLREITSATPLREGLGKVVYEAAPFVVGVGLARQFLSKGRTGDDDGESSGDGSDGDHSINATLADVGATLLGALFFGFNIAPTDEVPMIASAMSPAWIVAAMAASLVVSYAIVFEAGFSAEHRRLEQPGVIQHPVTETVVCYLVALVASALMLLFFQRWSFGDPLVVVLERTIVLALPATVGGAAGRLVVA